VDAAVKRERLAGIFLRVIQAFLLAATVSTRAESVENYIFQFLFRGDVRLALDSTNGEKATLKALFID
jgi:hypothetical protein